MIGFPIKECKGLGRSERILVPFPAANITTSVTIKDPFHSSIHSGGYNQIPESLQLKTKQASGAS